MKGRGSAATSASSLRTLGCTLLDATEPCEFRFLRHFLNLIFSCNAILVLVLIPHGMGWAAIPGAFCFERLWGRRSCTLCLLRARAAFLDPEGRGHEPHTRGFLRDVPAAGSRGRSAAAPLGCGAAFSSWSGCGLVRNNALTVLYQIVHLWVNCKTIIQRTLGVCWS